MIEVTRPAQNLILRLVLWKASATVTADSLATAGQQYFHSLGGYIGIWQFWIILSSLLQLFTNTGDINHSRH